MFLFKNTFLQRKHIRFVTCFSTSNQSNLGTNSCLNSNALKCKLKEQHSYHLVETSPYPFYVSLSVFLFFYFLSTIYIYLKLLTIYIRLVLILNCIKIITVTRFDTKFKFKCIGLILIVIQIKKINLLLKLNLNLSMFLNPDSYKLKRKLKHFVFLAIVGKKKIKIKKSINSFNKVIDLKFIKRINWDKHSTCFWHYSVYNCKTTGFNISIIFDTIENHNYIFLNEGYTNLKVHPLLLKKLLAKKANNTIILSNYNRFCLGINSFFFTQHYIYFCFDYIKKPLFFSLTKYTNILKSLKFNFIFTYKYAFKDFKILNLIKKTHLRDIFNTCNFNFYFQYIIKFILAFTGDFKYSSNIVLTYFNFISFNNNKFLNYNIILFQKIFINLEVFWNLKSYYLQNRLDTTTFILSPKSQYLLYLDIRYNFKPLSVKQQFKLKSSTLNLWDAFNISILMVKEKLTPNLGLSIFRDLIYKLHFIFSKEFIAFKAYTFGMKKKIGFNPIISFNKTKTFVYINTEFKLKLYTKLSTLQNYNIYIELNLFDTNKLFKEYQVFWDHRSLNYTKLFEDIKYVSKYSVSLLPNGKLFDTWLESRKSEYTLILIEMFKNIYTYLLLKLLYRLKLKSKAFDLVYLKRDKLVFGIRCIDTWNYRITSALKQLPMLNKVTFSIFKQKNCKVKKKKIKSKIYYRRKMHLDSEIYTPPRLSIKNCAVKLNSFSKNINYSIVEAHTFVKTTSNKFTFHLARQLRSIIFPWTYSNLKYNPTKSTLWLDLTIFWISNILQRTHYEFSTDGRQYLIKQDASILFKSDFNAHEIVAAHRQLYGVISGTKYIGTGYISKHFIDAFLTEKNFKEYQTWLNIEKNQSLIQDIWYIEFHFSKKVYFKDPIPIKSRSERYLVRNSRVQTGTFSKEAADIFRDRYYTDLQLIALYFFQQTHNNPIRLWGADKIILDPQIDFNVEDIVAFYTLNKTPLSVKTTYFLKSFLKKPLNIKKLIKLVAVEATLKKVALIGHPITKIKKLLKFPDQGNKTLFWNSNRHIVAQATRLKANPIALKKYYYSRFNSFIFKSKGITYKLQAVKINYYYNLIYNRHLIRLTKKPYIHKKIILKYSRKLGTENLNSAVPLSCSWKNLIFIYAEPFKFGAVISYIPLGGEECIKYIIFNPDNFEYGIKALKKLLGTSNTDFFGFASTKHYLAILLSFTKANIFCLKTLRYKLKDFRPKRHYLLRTFIMLENCIDKISAELQDLAAIFNMPKIFTHSNKLVGRALILFDLEYYNLKTLDLAFATANSKIKFIYFYFKQICKFTLLDKMYISKKVLSLPLLIINVVNYSSKVLFKGFKKLNRYTLTGSGWHEYLKKKKQPAICISHKLVGYHRQNFKPIRRLHSILDLHGNELVIGKNQSYIKSIAFLAKYTLNPLSKRLRIQKDNQIAVKPVYRDNCNIKLKVRNIPYYIRFTGLKQTNVRCNSIYSSKKQHIFHLYFEDYYEAIIVKFKLLPNKIYTHYKDLYFLKKHKLYNEKAINTILKRIKKDFSYTIVEVIGELLVLRFLEFITGYKATILSIQKDQLILKNINIFLLNKAIKVWKKIELNFVSIKVEKLYFFWTKPLESNLGYIFKRNSLVRLPNIISKNVINPENFRYTNNVPIIVNWLLLNCINKKIYLLPKIITLKVLHLWAFKSANLNIYSIREDYFFSYLRWLPIKFSHWIINIGNKYTAIKNLNFFIRNIRALFINFNIYSRSYPFKPLEFKHWANKLKINLFKIRVK